MNSFAQAYKINQLKKIQEYIDDGLELLRRSRDCDDPDDLATSEELANYIETVEMDVLALQYCETSNLPDYALNAALTSTIAGLLHTRNYLAAL
jgi:hypothetical protein